MEPTTLAKIVPEPRRLTRLALTSVVFVAVVGFLARDFRSVSHYMMLGELDVVSQWEGKQLKLHGWVQPGSIVAKEVDGETVCTFVLQQHGKKIRAFATGPIPAQLIDQAEIVASGQVVPRGAKQPAATSLGVPLDSDYVFDASDLSMKCVGRYDGISRRELKFF